MISGVACMSDKNILDTKRRRFLRTLAGLIGGIGGAVSTWPFIKMMSPSARAQAAGAPVEVDLSRIELGGMIREEWRGKPVWIVRRTPEMLESLDTSESHLRDPVSDFSEQPEYTKNSHRSIKPEYLVLVGVCTHLGCSPTFRPDIAPEDLGSHWPGGFFCACHGSRFDLAGRVYHSVPAPRNLEVPPYRFVSADRIVVGESGEENA